MPGERETARESGRSDAMDRGLMRQILAWKFHVARKSLTRLEVHRDDLLFHGVSGISWILLRQKGCIKLLKLLFYIPSSLTLKNSKFFTQCILCSEWISEQTTIQH